MKVVILAGGFGTRISEYTKTIPKPMIPINNTPILVHLINHYIKYNFNEFYIAVGYKSDVIKNYFKKNKIKDCKINLIDTGLNTMTGGRLKRLSKYFDKFLIEDLLKDLFKSRYSIYGDLYFFKLRGVILRSPKSNPSLPLTLFGK